MPLIYEYINKYKISLESHLLGVESHLLGVVYHQIKGSISSFCGSKGQEKNKKIIFIY